MVDSRQVRHVGRVTRVVAQLAGLVTASVLATGCSLLPGGGGQGKGAMAARGLRPELHEVKPNAAEDCLATTETVPGQRLSLAARRRAAREAAAAAAATATANTVTAAGAVESCTACACGGAGNHDRSQIADASSVPTEVRIDPVALGNATADEALQRLMDGNKRFVEGEAENAGLLPQVRPGETAKPGYKAMILACSDWDMLPEVAFDAKAGELYVVRVAGNTADEAVVDSARLAVQQYEIPLIIVLGHEHCTAVTAGGIHMDEAVEGRQAGHVERADAKWGSAIAAGDVVVTSTPAPPAPAGDLQAKVDAENKADAERFSGAAAGPIDQAIQANVDESVDRLLNADPALAGRVAAGRLTIVGAYYDAGNGLISLEPQHLPAAPAEATTQPSDAPANAAEPQVVHLPRD